MSTATDDKPPLASLVLAGEGQTEAVAITDFIFMVKDISNAYLVTTGDGDLLVNTGFMGNGDKTKALFAPHRTGELDTIILTQSHADHFGGVPELREDHTTVVAGKGFVENARDMVRLMPFFGPRTRKLWGNVIRSGPPTPPPDIVPDILVEKEYAIEQGGRRFELFLTPDGETTDALTVWMPREKVAFTGNLLGPVFMSMPNLTTLRGDKPRLVRSYLSSLDKLRSLGAELLITGHGEPIVGAERIKADLDKLYDAVAWVRDYTVDGMNAGKDVDTLVREVRLPDALKIAELHGKVSWAVRAIWQEYSNWFQHRSTTELYGVPFSSVHKDLAELAGGASALAARAGDKLAEGKPLEAIHLIDIALGAEPDNVDALKVKKAAHERLLAESGGTNLSESGWLKSEITAVENKLSPAG